MEERRCFNYRGRETNSFVREKERDPRAAATEEARRSAEGIRKREMMVASFLAKIISSRKESAPGESGAVPWKPGFFERRSLFLSLSLLFFSFYFKEAKPLAKPLFLSTASSRNRNPSPSLENWNERIPSGI